MTRREDLRQLDLIKGDPLECPQCNCYMTFKERLKNGKSKEGHYRRRRFECVECGFTEIIHAEGNKDVLPFVRKSRELNDHVKREKLNRKKIS